MSGYSDCISCCPQMLGCAPTPLGSQGSLVETLARPIRESQGTQISIPTGRLSPHLSSVPTSFSMQHPCIFQVRNVQDNNTDVY